jgi:hypothetical protein
VKRWSSFSPYHDPHYLIFCLNYIMKGWSCPSLNTPSTCAYWNGGVEVHMLSCLGVPSKAPNPPSCISRMPMSHVNAAHSGAHLLDVSRRTADVRSLTRGSSGVEEGEEEGKERQKTGCWHFGMTDDFTDGILVPHCLVITLWTRSFLLATVQSRRLCGQYARRCRFSPDYTSCL